MISPVIYQGDVLEQLRIMERGSVNCVVTSPPYWGLREYGSGDWDGGSSSCDHKQIHGTQGKNGARADRTHAGQIPYKTECGRCGARRLDRQIGLEETPDEYIAKLVEVFNEVRHVLKEDGTLWLNLGDSYANDGKTGGKHTASLHGGPIGRARRDSGLKPKDLVGIPWRVAFALQADGWWLRQDIIWHKPNPMPESVQDRCTKAHEYIFLMTKSERYYYDAQAIMEPAQFLSPNGRGQSPHSQGFGRRTKEEESERRGRKAGNKSHKYVTLYENDESEIHRTKAGLMKIADKEFLERNKRSVWTVATQPYKPAHFATFPPNLIRPCILAGCPQGGTVLDPFAGAGTTLMVAQDLQCHSIGIELYAEYIEMARERLRQAPLPLVAEG